jgi:hypothetical protein
MIRFTPSRAASVSMQQRTAAEQAEPDFGVALEDRADQIFGEIVVEHPERGPRGQRDTNHMFPDGGRSVEREIEWPYRS